MNRSSQKDGRFDLESLEPRLLLSADPLVDLVADCVNVESDPADAIAVSFEEISEDQLVAQEESNLFDEIEDEAMPAASGNDLGEEGFEDVLESGNDNTITSQEDVLPKIVSDDLTTLTTSDSEWTMSQELVMTLNAGNSPPDTEVGDDQFVDDSLSTQSNSTPTLLDEAMLDLVYKAALQAWDPYLDSDEVSSRLSSVELNIADLPDGAIGEANGLSITIDSTANEVGWFIDQTPNDNSEYESQSDGNYIATSDGGAGQGIDLLTVVAHELGHVLGLSHDGNDSNSSGLMSGSLETGVRYLPANDITLSADSPIVYEAQYIEITDEAAVGLAVGINQLNIRMELFLGDDNLLGDRVPILLKAGTTPGGDPVFEAPTVLDLLSVPVDANGDGMIDVDPFGDDDDEGVLQSLDAVINGGNNDGIVDTNEFLGAWLFDPINEYLNILPVGSTAAFEDFLKGGFLDALDHELTKFSTFLKLSDFAEVKFEMIDAKIDDTTEDPDAEFTFSLGFELSVVQSMPIDLGLQADALRILAFTGDIENAGQPKVPVTSKLSFGFEFGIFTGGQTPGEITGGDFFIRKADPLEVSVKSSVPDIADFHLNIGFLGADVIDGSLDLEADVDTELLDPNDPILLGFEDVQHGVEHTGGSVTGNLAVASPILDHDAGFFLRLGNIGVATELVVPAGDYGTMQGLEDAINLLLDSKDLGNLIEADIDGSDKLTFSIKPSLTPDPLGFGSEAVSATNALTGDNILNYGSNVTFMISENGELPDIVSVRFPDPSETEIGLSEAQTASLVDNLIANDAAIAGSVLTGDADFTLGVMSNLGVLTSMGVSVTQLSTVGNLNLGDLVIDVNTAIVFAGLGGVNGVAAIATGGKIALVGGANVAGIKIVSIDTLEAEDELGFSAGQNVTIELTGKAVGDPGFDDGDDFTDDTAVFHMSTNAGLFMTYEIDASPGRNLTDLVADLNLALFGTSVIASEDSGKIRLKAASDLIWAIEVRTENQDIDDLEEDLQRALDHNFISSISASQSGGDIQLVGDDLSDVLEISGTITFDAGVTWLELLLKDTDELFGVSEGMDSKVELVLPVKVLPGLYDADGGMPNWDPLNVAIVGNFNPFSSAAATFDEEVNRFRLNFKFTPTVDDQDDSPVAVPTLLDVAGEIHLVNFAELVNFSILTPGSMLGLLDGLGTALRQLSNTAAFVNYDIPFADATLSDLLNFADSDKVRFSGLIDLLLYDTGGTGIDPDLAPDDDVDKLLKRIFVDGNSFLIPAFSTAQTMATRLEAILDDVAIDGAGGINATYDTVSNELTYQLVNLRAESRTVETVSDNVALVHNVPLEPFDKLTIDSSVPSAETEVELTGRTGLDMTFGVDLSPPGFFVFPITTLDKLNAGEGVEILHVKAITGTVDIPIVQIPPVPNPIPDPEFQLGGDATFSISLDGGVTSKEVTIFKDAVFNRTMGDFVSDVNNALVVAELDGDIIADFDGQRLVLAALSDSTNFEITAANITTLLQIGFTPLAPASVAEKADFVVFTRDGVAHEVSLDSLDSSIATTDDLDDVLTLLNAVAPASFTAGFNATQTGLRLTDITGGGGEFRVDSINGSGAQLGLGLFITGDDLLPDPFGNWDPNLIEGGGIGLTGLDDRFFVRDAQLRIDGLSVKTPGDGASGTPFDGVPGQGLYGIVGVDVNVEGEFIANVTAQLTDPFNLDILKNQITLAELLKQTGTLEDPVVSKAVELDYDNQAPPIFPFAEFTVGGLLLTGTAGDSANIVGVDDGGSFGTLLLANVKGDFADDEPIFQQVSVSTIALAMANGTPTAPAATAGFGSFDLGVTVQAGFDDLGFDGGFNGLDGASYTIPFDLTGFGEPIGPTDPTTSALNLSLLDDLEDLDLLSYSHFRSTLEGLLDVLQDVDTNFAELNAKLPAINRSVGELLDLVDGFERGVGNANAVFDDGEFAISPLGEPFGLPALRLQDMPRALRGALGLPVGVTPGPGTVDWVKLDYVTGVIPELLLTLNLHEELSTKLGLDIETGPGLPNLTSAGVLEVSGALDVLLNVAIDLDVPTSIFLLDTTNISGTFHVQGEGQEYAGGEDGLGLVFRSALGPLSVFIQDGDVLIDFDFSLPGLDFDVGGGETRKPLADVEFEDWNDADISKDEIDIVLPMFYGGEGPNDFIGEYSASGTFAPIPGITIVQPDFGPIADDITLEVVPYDPFENILLAIDTLDLYLELLGDQLAGEVLGIELPFIGDQMADVLFIEDFRRTLVRTLKNGIENAVNPDPDTVIGDLITAAFTGPLALYLVGSPTQTPIPPAPPADPEERYREWSFTVAHQDTIIIDDFDIGPDHLTFDVDAPVTVTFDWSIDITFGVDFGNGAYIDVSDGKELDLHLTIKMPEDMNTPPPLTAYTGKLGFFKLDVTDPGSPSGANLQFDVDVNNSLSGDARLGFADIGSLSHDATLTGGGLNNTDPAVTFKIKTTDTRGLPVMSSDFIFDWMLPVTDVDDLEGDAVTPGIQVIALNNMDLDTLSGIKELLGGPFEEVAKIVAPFMPIVDLLTEPIPILSDVAGEPFTLLDLAAIFGDVNPEFIEAIADILDIISTVNDIVGLPVLPLGSFTLYNIADGADYFDPSKPNETLGKFDPADYLGLGGGLVLDSDFGLDADANGFLNDIRAGALVDGLSMPVFDSALEGINLLVNRDADLVKYDLPALGVSFEYLQVFPIWGPLAVSIEISFGFTLDLHAVGFDTFGYRRFAEGGFRNEALIFDGFFLDDLEGGVDLPEIVFEFGLVGAAELNLGIARAGVAGGINATITFDWHDSIPDGNVHASEIIGNIIVEGGNPLAPFDVGGELTFSLSAFLEIELLGIDLEFPITGEITLFDFNEDFDRKPKLGTVEGGTLFLNMGPNSQDRLNGDTSDGNEEFSLERDGTSVHIWSDKLGVGYGDKQEYKNVTHIVGLGGEGDDKIIMTGFDGSPITGDFDGGVGDDVIEFDSALPGSSGPGSLIVGGLGNDTLTGGHLNDIIYGNEGNDTIKGSGGYDILFGDSGRVADEFISSRIRESDGADDIDGGDDDDIVIGAGGSDILRGGEGTDLILGDGGRFNYTETGDHIDVAALLPTAYEPEPINGVPPSDPDKISSDIDAVEDAVLEKIRAANLGLGGNDMIFGDGGNDLVLGGTGDDVIEGNDGDDVLLGGKGFDDIMGGNDDDAIFGGDQADRLAGNDGDDVMAGGAGNDHMHGNADDDVMKGGTGADVMFGDAGDDQVFGQTEPDVLFGGVDDDLVVGGSSNDIMFGDDGLVAKLDPTGNVTLKLIGIGNPALVGTLLTQFRDANTRTLDLIITDVVAGDGNDIMSGDAGDDIMLGGGGNDLMGGDVDPRLPTAGTPTEISEDVMIGDGGKITFNERRFRKIETIIGADATGTPFNDVIYGDNGNDYILGGRGSDFLFGGHGKVVDVGTETVGAFRGETDEEASDNDIIVGDNGEMLFADDLPVEEKDNFGRLELVRTTDISDLTGGHEYVEGELGNDVIFGGVNGSVDVLIGNAGSDVILGDNGELDFDFDDAGDLDTLDLIRSYRDGLGGIDIISGDQDDDVLIGGTAADEMYGDNAEASNGAADGEDIMLGDNGDLFLIGTVGRLTVLVADMPEGTAVDLITTTDQVDVAHPTLALAEAVGGPDTMSGNAGSDIMLGGVNNDDGAGDPEVDSMYGDRAAPTSTTIANDSDDILLGDNGLLDFTFDTDTDRNTLDLIQSFEDALGGMDIISGNKGLDVGIGGTGDDTIYGDDAGATAGADDLGDLLLGDNADIFLVDDGGESGGDIKIVLSAAVRTIVTTDETYDPNVAANDTGGVDTISGNAAGDIIAGGVEGDTLYGDAMTSDVVPELDGDDIILGDNGAFEWLSTGRLGDIPVGIDVQANNVDLYDWFTTGDGNPNDTDLTTLDLITTEQPNNGGRDTIYGDEADDLVFGGTDLDVIYGDDGDELNEGVGFLNRDVLFGDHGRLYPQFPRFQIPNSTDIIPADFPSRNFFAIDIGDGDGGEGDIIRGEEGDDILLGQQGDDRMWGGSGDDDMIGGHNVAGGYDELTAPAVNATLNPDMNDLMDGGSGDDAMAGDNAIIWRRGDDITPRFRTLANGETAIYTTNVDVLDPEIDTNVDSAYQSNPDDAVGRDIELVDHADNTATGLFGADVMAGGADSDVMYGQLDDDLMQGDGSIESAVVVGPWVSHTLTIDDDTLDPLDTDETLYFNIPEQDSDADDYMEGNGGNDLMYGGLGQDDIIGGSSELFGLVTEVMRPDGSDIIFGGAGAPARLVRNDFVGLTDTDTGVFVELEEPPEGAVPTDDDPSIELEDRHSRDADFIMGDNANVFRLVAGGEDGTPEDRFLEFNYDQDSAFQDRGDERIVVRGMEQLDYTLGGADYHGGEYVNGAADLDLIAGPNPTDNGLGDLIHGESGDDYIFGMTGSDVIFGESDDDDIVGGYGNDWISGGTGQDGVIGDDGLLLTSRNSIAGEPLYGIVGLSANDPSAKYSHGTALDELISTPGKIQIAVINPTGALKKTADLQPFSFEQGWFALDDEFPGNEDNAPFADDIIFGGLDSDFLHGGSGDDAISGAEALEHAYVPIGFVNGSPTGILDLGYNAFDLMSPVNPGDTVANPNPGDVLAFNPIDLDGQHLNNRFRAGEFFLYDEYDPRRKILLTLTGELYKDINVDGEPAGVEGELEDYVQFLLNFDELEGLYRHEGDVPKATGQQTEHFDDVNDDGKDAVFGDLGNDWLVGGTGRDNIYGGWGNDLLNADDDHKFNDDGTKQNTVSDTHPTYEDRAYGGAGRDILIGNTGGDRLIDWVGEYNSFLVPYAPFGQASVSRTMMPFLPEFLYALSSGDGADPTRYVDAVNEFVPEPTRNSPNPSRNGEPHGELGLVLQQDFAWQDQTGAPADPQAGNIPGGHRDVLRTAGFGDGSSDGFFADSGVWEVSKGSLLVEPSAKGGDALSLFYVDSYVPTYYEMLAILNPVKPTGGYKSNAYLVFDYQSDTDFKFAGINVSTNKLEIGHVTEEAWFVDVQGVHNGSLKSNTNYNVFLAVNGTTATLVVDGKTTLTHTFEARIDYYGFAHGLNEGMVGLGAQNSKARIDNVVVQRLAPIYTYTETDEFEGFVSGLFEAPISGVWSVQNGQYVGDSSAEDAIVLIDREVSAAAVINLSTSLETEEQGGFVFDYYGPNDYKFATYSSEKGEVVIGHQTSKGLTVDAVYSHNSLKSKGSQNFEITLKGSTISIKVDSQLMLSFAFNALVTDGDFGLLSKGGETDFDQVTFQTDDPHFLDFDGSEELPLYAINPVSDPVAQAQIFETNPDNLLADDLSTTRISDETALAGTTDEAWLYLETQSSQEGEESDFESSLMMLPEVDLSYSGLLEEEEEEVLLEVLSDPL